MPSSFVTVDLKELEWVKVLEITVPPDLVWLGLIHMLRPVQSSRADLTSLIGCIREQAASVKRPRERGTLLGIANKMEHAMQQPPSTAIGRQATSEAVPNNKHTVFKTMRQDLRQWRKQPASDNPFNADYIRFIKGVIDQPRGRPKLVHPNFFESIDGATKSAMTILRTLKCSALAYAEVQKHLATQATAGHSRK